MPPDDSQSLRLSPVGGISTTTSLSVRLRAFPSLRTLTSRRVLPKHAGMFHMLESPRDLFCHMHAYALSMFRSPKATRPLSAQPAFLRCSILRWKLFFSPDAKNLLVSNTLQRSFQNNGPPDWVCFLKPSVSQLNCSQHVTYIYIYIYIYLCVCVVCCVMLCV